MKLALNDVSAGYGRVIAIRSMTLSVSPGETVAIIGSNGAGKSTLAKVIAGQLKARSGVILDGPREITTFSAAQRAQQGIILVPEGRRLFAGLTVGENIALGRRLARYRTAEPDSLSTIFDAFPVIEEKRNQRAALLSGGQQQLVALARAVAAKPRYLILDEPSLGLSPLLVQEVMRLIQLIGAKTNAGIVLVEQMANQALSIADRAYVIEQGEIVLEGPASELAKSGQVRKNYLGR